MEDESANLGLNIPSAQSGQSSSDKNMEFGDFGGQSAHFANGPLNLGLNMNLAQPGQLPPKNDQNTLPTNTLPPKAWASYLP